jgi:hypothetical protein
MARFEPTGHDRYRIESAREALAAAKSIDWSDAEAGPHMVGRLQVVVENLLDILDEHQADESGD